MRLRFGNKHAALRRQNLASGSRLQLDVDMLLRYVA